MNATEKGKAPNNICILLGRPYNVAMNIRAEAIKLLSRWERGGVFAESLVDGVVAEGGVSSQDRALLTALVMGVLRNKSWFDYLIDSMRKKGHLEIEIRHLLRLGLCQILVLKMPAHAAVNETVNLAPRKVAGLVNALLRRTLREEERILAEKETLPLSVRYSMPEWLVWHWLECFGPEVTESLLKRQQEVPTVFARRNPLIPLDGEESSLGLEEVSGLAGWYKVTGSLPIADLRSGALYIADPSTRFCVELLAPSKGERILDACAAPGGKSVAILTATEGNVRLLATDAAEHRLPRLKDNLEKFRSASGTLETEAFDWTKPCPEKWMGKFEGVLLDVPCSNSGVLQRRVDARWRLSLEEIKRLSQLQLQILENASAAVSPGGRLIYSTCSIDPMEDSGVVKEFLALHNNWRCVTEKLVLPFEAETDGAYAARLVRS